MARKKHAWEASYPKGVDWEFEPVLQPIYDMLKHSYEKHPKRIALEFLGKTMTYEELWKEVCNFASGLQRRGIKKGDKVGICLPNSFHYVISYYGVLMTGATVVNFNPLYTEAEIATLSRDSGVRIMITTDIEHVYEKVFFALNNSDMCSMIVAPFTDNLPFIKKTLFNIFKPEKIAKLPDGNTVLPWDRVSSLDSEPDPVRINPAKDIALYQYTGGTTGLPKAAMLTHSNVVTNAEQCNIWRKASGEVTDHDIFLGVIPFFHVFAMTALMNLSMRRSGTLHMYPKFDLKQTLQGIHKHKPTIFAGVPALYNAIINYEKINKYNLTSMQFCISGGAALPAEVCDEFVEKTGTAMVEGYGLSETSPVACCNQSNGKNKANSIGLPLPGTEISIRSLEDRGKECKTGDVGEIAIRGPQVMKGYAGRIKETKEVFYRDWLLTGDVGYIDEDGYVYITDRLKEMINVSGFKVYPRHIEEVLYSHSAVMEAAVIGIPHAKKGEIPKAFVALKKGQNVTAEELKKYAEAHLNPYEKIAEVEFRDELPKSMIGKLLKRELIQEEKQKTKRDKQAKKKRISRS